MKIDIITGAHLKRIFSAGSRLLEKCKEEIDSLNVFPVPDGDTGTNMTLTARAAAQKALEIEGDSLAEVAAAASIGSLMGARGNSGVILSQIFRGWATALAGKEKATPLELAQAFQAGAKVASQAVMKPVEGTILTVAREGAQGAQIAARAAEDILGVLKGALQQSAQALARTPDLLPALKEAGVVDAGGRGLVVFLEGALAGLQGNQPEVPSLPGSPEDSLRVRGTETGPAGEAGLSPSEFQYCTEFLLKGQNLPLETVTKDLALEGDCLLVVGERDLAKIHIHTNHPGKVLEYCLQLGSLHEIKIHNMHEQQEALADKLAAAGEGASADPPATPTGMASPARETGIVAVAAGEGFREILQSLGADEVIQGGQTMNPSAEDLVRGVERVAARQVIILPNNKNIIMAAEQAKTLTAKEITVLPTCSLPQGIAALLAFDPEASFASNQQNMLKATSRVVSGEITRAVRDSLFQGREIREGDILGLVDGKIIAVGSDRGAVLAGLLTHAREEHHELVTLYYGSEVSAEEAENHMESLRQAFPELEIELHYGGQPLYDFLFSLE